MTGPRISQPELLDLLDIEEPRVRSVFLNSAIERRHLTLPPVDEHGNRRPEAQGDLLDKHSALAVEMGAQALEACLKSAGASLSDLRHLCCVTSTGFLTPGISALIIRELGIDRHAAAWTSWAWAATPASTLSTSSLLSLPAAREGKVSSRAWRISG